MKTKAIAFTVEEKTGFYQRLKLSMAHFISGFPEMTMLTPDALRQETRSSERRLVVGGKVITIRHSFNRDQ